MNTGFGGTADVRTRQAQELQRVLIRELHYGIVAPSSRDPKSQGQCGSSISSTAWKVKEEDSPQWTHLPKTWTRAAIAIRINSLIKGCSSIRPIIVERLLDLLKHDIIPVIPLRGSISASGDLSPLSYIGGAIQGKPTIRIHSDGERFADQAFAGAKLEPVILDAKEGLAIVNGTAISAASGALVLEDAHMLTMLAQVLTAMSVEALAGTLESFESFFSEVRPHPGQIEAADNVRRFLHGSKLVQINTGSDAILRQDRYSIRTAPQWLGPVLEDFMLAHQQITIECNSATDNPLESRGQMLHGGNFQAKAVTSAMEKIRQGNCCIGRMLFTQCTEMINPSTSRGLPPNLVAEDPSTSFIFKGTDMAMAGLQSELGFLSTPVNHVQTAEMGNQSLNSLALISARYTHTSNEVLTHMIAAHLIAVCQAVDIRAMNIKFFETFRPEFDGIFKKAYPHQPSSSVDLDALRQELLTKLWKQLIKYFESTVNMDAKDRFTSIALSLRNILIDDPVYHNAHNTYETMQEFCRNLAASMYESWIAHRDAYMVHGDAAGLLGYGSQQMYRFIREDLAIPFLCSDRIRTPSEQNGISIEEAPTVGSYTTIVYQAIRGSAFKGVLLKLVAGEDGRASELAIR